LEGEQFKMMDRGGEGREGEVVERDYSLREALL
jgi:hypothetical protein